MRIDKSGGTHVVSERLSGKGVSLCRTTLANVTFLTQERASFVPPNPSASVVKTMIFIISGETLAGFSRALSALAAELRSAAGNFLAGARKSGEPPTRVPPRRNSPQG